MPLCLTVSWVYTVAMLVQSIVHEKEQRLKEVMKMMGMSNAVHWLAWAITSFTQMSITMVILTVMLRLGNVLAYSNPVIIFMMLEIFGLATISFSFLISVLYSKAKLAAACAGIIYFLSYVPCMYIAIREESAHMKMSTTVKRIASLMSTSAFGLGAKYFAFYEEGGSGVQWSNFDKSPVEDDDFTLYEVTIMMIVDTVLYIVLMWYIENIHPGSYGLPKPWYFPLTKSYWLGASKTDLEFCSICPDNAPITLMEEDQAHVLDGDRDPRLFEEETSHLPLGVCIDNLLKVYSDGNKLAVNRLSLNLYEGQITSFLGHNGAGKTTTMSILTGLFPPTSGTATIYGHDIRAEMDEIRQSLGMCPQHNVLFHKLTVEEHLWFYAMLKGGTHKNIKEEIDQLIEDVGLPNKRNSCVDYLSGGMKRKLSVAIAFVGGAKTIILDEPTAGVDPFARRAIWDLLIKYKKGRTVLLSTHHMDEADILGDRIAIISNGQLKCCGSSLFLKSVLGEGYHLTVVKMPDSSSDSDDPCILNSSRGSMQPFSTLCEQSQVTDFITSHVETAYLESESNHELHYILPTDEIRSGGFVSLFRALERSLDQLHISSYGLKDSTLEEVFLNIAQAAGINNEDGEIAGRHDNASPAHTVGGPHDLELGSLAENNVPQPLIGSHSFVNNSSDSNSNTDYSTAGLVNTDRLERGRYPMTRNWRHARHFWTILVKRMHYTRRNWKGVCTQEPPECWPQWSQDANPQQLVATLYLPSGVGATCVLKDPFNNTDFHNMSANNFYLLAEYFTASCMSVFVKGVPLENFVPPPPTAAPLQQSSDVNYTTLPPATERSDHPRMYPLCYCAPDKTGFICPPGGYTDPPQKQAITGDMLIDITGQNSSEYFLYTTDKFRLRRYGGLSFGNVVDYVPEWFGQNAKPLFRKIAVRNVAKAWYNHQGYHSIPTYLNTLNNAILRANLPASKGNPAAYGITVINHPMAGTNDLLSFDYLLQGTDVLIAIFVVIAMSFVPASFVLFLVYERSMKAKHLHMMCGVSPITYWLANFLWDMCNSLIPSIICISIFRLFNVPAYASEMNFPAVVALFLMYGCAITPIMYPASFFFTEPSMAYICLIVGNLFVGITCILTSFILEMFTFGNGTSDYEYFKTIHETLKTVFLIFPNYALGRTLMDIAFNEYYNQYFARTDQYDKIVSPLSWQLVPRSMVAMATMGLIFLVITLFAEYKFCYKSKRLAVSSTEVEDEDADVAAERKRVLQGAADFVRVENLTKEYSTHKLGKLLAVDKLCFGVPQGECFGLLGVNGAGKTTTFKMLTGDTSITGGDAFLNNKSIMTDARLVQQSTGYCPQFDALYDELTPREHLTLYARFRGVPFHYEKQMVDWSLRKLALTLYADKTSGTLSGGNRRKLSTAIALAGNPVVLFLDEPTTGMDPHSRRFLWDLIRGLIKEGCSVILTSHSMEECEALCTRLAVMVNGKMKCLGSTQHLKNRFGDGYTIQVRAKGSQPNLDPIIRHLAHHVPKATLEERHHNTLQYEMKPDHISLASIFTAMENLPASLNIEDYSVSQKTLDNVFIKFVKQQTEFSNLGNSSTGLNLDSDSDDSLLDLHSSQDSQLRLAFMETPDC
ncbi:PREDICTED: ATP-binding cassette sub-family A member 2-like isoform X2 [Priapulus caudatus]|uniref:ATP-binding cassette sub-family A member 2-like isoform X2 n=1 Tax=Priapulus caudatus TaxID=37621 RepID=A0ABM1DZC9_PRICU|nr:PREDICTED: ATP-binding cassette sub-family A member 2-like isoform X2 [Priapulus caudatus]